MDDCESFEVEHYPPWREALRQFRAAGFEPGDLIEFRWFYDALGLVKPEGMIDAAEYPRFNMEWTRGFSRLRSALLIEDKVDLINQTGIGHYVAVPAEQSERAYCDGVKEMKSALRRMMDRIVHTDVSRLTTEQRVAYANDLARAAAMANAVRSSRRLLTHRDEGED